MLASTVQKANQEQAEAGSGRESDIDEDQLMQCFTDEEEQ